MNLDLEKRTERKTTFAQCWLKEQYKKLRDEISEEIMSDKELQSYLLEKYKERKTPVGRIYNNVDATNRTVSLENFINEFLNTDTILTGYDCLYKSHKDAVNIGSLALDALLTSRKKYKKQMEAADYGSDTYVYFRVLQLTFKVLANSYYGILGEKNSIFYNPFVQNSITCTGQSGLFKK